MSINKLVQIKMFDKTSLFWLKKLVEYIRVFISFRVFWLMLDNFISSGTREQGINQV